MKSKILALVAFSLLSSFSFSQTSDSVPKSKLENLKGQSVSSELILNTTGPTILSFWATWCKPCILELNELQDIYGDWQEEFDVKLLAISIDDTRSSSKVPSFANGKGWDFDIYIDKNSDYKRLLNINNVPHTILLNSKGEIVWQHSGYTLGDEELLYEELVKLKEN